MRAAHLPFLESLAVLGLLTMVTPAGAQGFWNGRQIMEEVHRRHHEFPYVYEEHSLVLVDSMGRRDTRQARRYSRIEENGELKLLYVFETPPDVKGVTLFARRDPEGRTSSAVYLPALGTKFLDSAGMGSGGNLIGTDFAIEDLTAENPDDYDYERMDDEKADDLEFFVIDVYPAVDRGVTRRRLRRHYVRQDNFFITRTDHYSRLGLVYKRQSFHDLKKMDEEMWRAGVILMDDRKLKHQSLIKINRRIFSPDYVPAEMFSREWILAAYPPLNQSPGGTTGTQAAETGAGGDPERDSRANEDTR
jgi:hypothetical protein